MSVSYFNFDNKVLGHGLTAAYILEPSYRMGSKAQFRFRTGAGLSYLTNPFHAERNPTNMSYSYHVSGYLQVGLFVSHRLNKRLLLQVGANYQHISNGGLKEPNKGINWPTASLGVTYVPANYNLPSYRRVGVRTFKEIKPTLEAGIFFTGKQGFQPGDKRARTPLVGLVVQGSKQVGTINAIIAGIEMYYDNALNQQLKMDSVKGSGLRAGLLAGHDFLLGKFNFSQQLGFYLYNRSPYYDRFYHRWSIRYKINNTWMAGFALKAHRQVADFIDVRILYRIKR